MSAQNKVTLEIPEKLGFLWEPHRYKVAYGGRAGAKSHSFARVLLAKAAKEKLRVLCVRELQVSIADSVHKLLGDLIVEYRLGGFFEVLQTTIRGRNGSEFLFAGIRNNISKIRSMEAIDIVWIEEGQSISEESWSVLIPTIRKPGSEIWISMNPDQPTDPTYKRFISHPPPDCVSVEIGWEDNPWISEESLRDKDHSYAVDPDAAAHIWGGKPRTRSKAQVLHGKWVVEPFVPNKEWNGPYQGADWGFATDPSVFVRCWVSGNDESLERELWIEYEAYGVGVDINELPQLFGSIPNASKYATRADSARPETISHMKQHGFPRMIAAQKGPGSVEDGVAHLRSYSRIVIHPRCKHTIDEARLWSWKTDKLSGDILPVLVDKHDHCWDSARYALEPVMKRQKKSYSGYKSATNRKQSVTAQDSWGSFRSKTGGIL